MSPNTTFKKAIVSPHRADTFALGSMGFLTSCYVGGNGKANGKKSRLNSTFYQRRRVYDDAKAEPASPRVTCVGQVKVKPEKTTSSSRSRHTLVSRSKSSLAPLVKKIESLFETVCCVGPSRGRGDDRLRKLEEPGSSKSEIVPAGPPPTHVLMRCRGTSSARTCQLDSLPSAPIAEREEEKTERESDSKASEIEPARKDSGDEESSKDSESLKRNEIEGGSDEADTTTSKADAVARFRRCISEPGRIRRRRFVSDPDLEIRRRPGLTRPGPNI